MELDQYVEGLPLGSSSKRGLTLTLVQVRHITATVYDDETTTTTTTVCYPAISLL